MTAKLFSPIKFRDLECQNRVVIAPMCQYSATDGVANDWHLMHLGHLALGGAGLLICEATGVSADGRITPGCLGLYNDEQETALKRVIDFCHEVGSAHFAVQLAHAGRKASTSIPWLGGGKALSTEDGAWPTIAPSAVPFTEGWHVPAAMNRADMDRVRDDFVAATKRCDRMGVDLIELHAAHGYLLCEFLSPIANHRDDEYGGSLENRMRFPLEVFAAVREAWPDNKPLGVRISATDWELPGITIDESVVLSRTLKDLGCDFIDCSTGGNLPSRPPVGNGEQGYQVTFSRQIRAEADIPTMAVGKILEAGFAESVITEGDADMVALARGMLQDPRWAWHAAAELGAEAPYPPQYARSKP